MTRVIVLRVAVLNHLLFTCCLKALALQNSACYMNFPLSDGLQVVICTVYEMRACNNVSV